MEIITNPGSWKINAPQPLGHNHEKLDLQHMQHHKKMTLKIATLQVLYNGR